MQSWMGRATGFLILPAACFCTAGPAVMLLYRRFTETFNVVSCEQSNMCKSKRVMHQASSTIFPYKTCCRLRAAIATGNTVLHF